MKALAYNKVCNKVCSSFTFSLSGKIPSFSIESEYLELPIKFSKCSPHRAHRGWQALFLLLFLWSCSSQKAQSLPVTSLRVGSQTVEAELALSPEQQAQGLMFRKSMAEMHGMLFSFPQDRLLRFYMKNTLLPLSIAYLDKEGYVREIYDMQPLDETTVPSQWPMRFALEMQQGWFERHNVQLGDRVVLADGRPLLHSSLEQLAGK